MLHPGFNYLYISLDEFWGSLFHYYIPFLFPGAMHVRQKEKTQCKGCCQQSFQTDAAGKKALSSYKKQYF